MDSKLVYRVPKISIDVVLSLAGTQKLPSSVYLAEVSSTHDGSETLDEFLNQDTRHFVPVHVTSTDRDILVSKKLIVYLSALFSRVPAEPFYDVEPTTSADVLVELLTGDKLRGKIHIYREVQHSRVLDFLNDKRQFLPLYSGEDVIFINRDFIRSVEEQFEQES